MEELYIFRQGEKDREIFSAPLALSSIGMSIPYIDGYMND